MHDGASDLKALPLAKFLNGKKYKNIFMASNQSICETNRESLDNYKEKNNKEIQHHKQE